MVGSDSAGRIAAFACSPFAKGAQKLAPFAQHSLALLGVPHHLPRRLEEVLGAEIIAAVKTLDGVEDLLVAEVRITDGALLVAGLVAVDGIDEEPVVAHVVEEVSAGVR